MHRLGMIVALTAALLPMISLAQSQSEMEDISASSYAKENEVSIAEATKRLKIQLAMNDVDIPGLRREFESRFAGMFLAHQPDQHMVVRLVGSSPVSPRVIKTSEGDLRVVFRVDQKNTYADLKKITSEFETELTSIPGVQGLYVDQKTGEIVLEVAAPDKEKAVYERKKNQLEKALGAPIRFEVSRAPLVNLAYAIGGARLDSSGSACTTGFAVENTVTGEEGVITAAHCPNPQFYANWEPPESPKFIGFPLQFKAELRDSSRDVQWHTAPGHNPLGEIFGKNTFSSAIINRRTTRLATTIGQAVCHRGTASGYSCGQVVDIEYMPVGTNPCGLLVCDDTWVAVKGSNLACSQGDSGGPVFNLNWAYGIVSSASFTGNLPGQCQTLVYMSVDYLKDLNLKLHNFTN